MSPKKAAWYNRRAKMLGGYATMSPINTNKAADIYYRKSTDELLEEFLNSAIRQVKRRYDTVYTKNAPSDIPPIKRSPSKVASTFQSLRADR